MKDSDRKNSDRTDSEKSTLEQPAEKRDGQGTDQTSDRAQPELTEQNLLVERRSEADTPEERDALESDLEGMQGDIQKANDK